MYESPFFFNNFYYPPVFFPICARRYVNAYITKLLKNTFLEHSRVEYNSLCLFVSTMPPLYPSLRH